ncbi:hypothetical protein SADUNF_Sadunf10G0103100 [Salix dunnii]|uniref:Uncharacterized protein n=1 Tax=Salix dunnii TaxID=1413687 RepID=A0A835JQP8_9ROSI|nr:hypothetical protein SADUNF_Sadunf10G0103100 [Salix dunnii]
MLGPAKKEIRDDRNRRVSVRLEPRDNGVIELGRCCNNGQGLKGGMGRERLRCGFVGEEREEERRKGERAGVLGLEEGGCGLGLDRETLGRAAVAWWWWSWWIDDQQASKFAVASGSTVAECTERLLGGKRRSMPGAGQVHLFRFSSQVALSNMREYRVNGSGSN